MSLLLGIFSKHDNVDAEKLSRMLGDFSGERRRQTASRSHARALFMAAAPSVPERVFAEDGDDATTLGLIGSLGSSAGCDTNLEGFLRRLDATSLQQAEGSFAAFRYDAATHELRVANDKFGTRALFVAETADLFAFCSEYQPLLELPGLDRTLDHDAIAEYYSLGTTLGDKTFFRHIRNLRPGTILELSAAGCRASRYWVPRIGICHDNTPDRAAAELAATLGTIVRELIDKRPDLTCLLTAGADSRLILSCMRDDQLASMQFLTSKLSVLGADEDRDVIGATALVRALELRHEILDVAWSEIEFGPDYFDRERRLRRTDLLGGWHGGEFLGGCCDAVAPIGSDLDRATVDARLSAVFSPGFLISLDHHPWETYQGYLHGLEAENRVLLAQVEQLTRAFFSNVYKGSQGHWLQPFQIVHHGHSPFWDSRFLAAMLKVPFLLLQDYGVYNAIFRDHFPSLAQIPSNSMLTRRADSALPPMAAGQEPKTLLKMRPRQLDALEQMGAAPAIRTRGDYASDTLAGFMRDASSVASLMFVDFEAWRLRYVDVPG